MQDKRNRRINFGQLLGLRRRPRQVLRHMERQLNEAEQLARTGSWIWRPDDGVVWLAGMYSIFGLDPAGALSMTRFLEIVHPDDRQAIQDGPRAWSAAC